MERGSRKKHSTKYIASKRDFETADSVIHLPASFLFLVETCSACKHASGHFWDFPVYGSSWNLRCVPSLRARTDKNDVGVRETRLPFIFPRERKEGKVTKIDTIDKGSRGVLLSQLLRRSLSETVKTQEYMAQGTQVRGQLNFVKHVSVLTICLILKCWIFVVTLMSNAVFISLASGNTNAGSNIIGHTWKRHAWSRQFSIPFLTW